MTSIVLDEVYDENYVPTEKDIIEYAEYLGIDIQQEEHLLWIAREGLKTPLPKDWKPCQTDDGHVYYFNFKTGQSMWDHPCDAHYKEVYQKEKTNSALRDRSTKSSQKSTLKPLNSIRRTEENRLYFGESALLSKENKERLLHLYLDQTIPSLLKIRDSDQPKWNK